MPCSSVNSFTISVVRSHFESRRRVRDARSAPVDRRVRRQGDHALGLLEIRAELRLERDMREVVNAIGELFC